MTFATFLPHRARIAEIVPESADTRTFVLALDRPVPALDAAQPGQFVMLSLFGYGEAAFTLSALPGAGGLAGMVVVTVRRVGSLTSALFTLQRGGRVGVRGPYGHGFPDDPGVPTIFVAGGCGLSPLKPAIARQIAARPRGTKVAIVYGARTPDARIHRAALADWARAPDVQLVECVDLGEPGWRGRVGVVTDYVGQAVAAVGARRAAVCGPPVMLRLAADRLCRLGLDPAQIDVAVERYMKCATGLCGHCYVNHRYVCRDGPVFPYAELRALPDAFGGLAPLAAASC
jgi:NAD(P)H-flavin reductase